METEPACGTPGDPDARLTRLRRLAEEAGAQELARDAAALAQRTAEARFYVAVVGQFKRGKSTLLNALLSAPLLPTGVLPVTAVPTVVRHGSPPRARVELATGDSLEIPMDRLPEFVSEPGNPSNSKNVCGVEVFSESALLESGMCLVDTPGIGSIFPANTQATRSFVPHVDAAVVVLGTDPPIAAEELALVEELAKHVRRFIFVLNKADRVSSSDLEEARAFTRKALEKDGRRVERV